MSNRTATVTTVYLNNSTTPSTVSRTVNCVIVGDNIIPDFRETNPGVVNSAYTEFPNSRADNL